MPIEHIDLMNRTFLQALGKVADQLAQNVTFHPHWKRVFKDLCHAANCLDAFLARTDTRNIPSETSFNLDDIVYHPTLGEVEIKAWDQVKTTDGQTSESYTVVLTNPPLDPLGEPYDREFTVAPSELSYTKPSFDPTPPEPTRAPLFTHACHEAGQKTQKKMQKEHQQQEP